MPDFKKIIPADSAPPVGPYTPGIDTGDFIFFSGQIALDKEGNFHGESLESECTQVFKNLDALFVAAKITKENVVKTTVFLKNIDDFEAVNKRYAEYFGDHKPARSCVQAVLPVNATVEIEVIAKR